MFMALTLCLSNLYGQNPHGQNSHGVFECDELTEYENVSVTMLGLDSLLVIQWTRVPYQQFLYRFDEGDWMSKETSGGNVQIFRKDIPEDVRKVHWMVCQEKVNYRILAEGSVTIRDCENNSKKYPPYW